MTTLSFSISAPGHLSTEQMLQIARYAHQTAQALGFQRVEPLLLLESEDIQQLLARWQEEVVSVHPFNTWAALLISTAEYELYAVRTSARYDYLSNEAGELESVACVYPQRLVGFLAISGRGCTDLRLTFAQYPADVHAVDDELTFGWWAKDHVYFEDVPDYGVEHLVQCYLRHMLLFRALRRRFPVLRIQVEDPARYWKSGSLNAVIRWARALVSSDWGQKRLQRVVFRGDQPASTDRTIVLATPDRGVLRELLSHN